MEPLSSKEGSEYEEALKIIQAGQARLEGLPREDLLGPDAPARTRADVSRFRRYLEFASSQAKVRKAASSRDGHRERP